MAIVGLHGAGTGSVERVRVNLTALRAEMARLNWNWLRLTAETGLSRRTLSRIADEEAPLARTLHLIARTLRPADPEAMYGELFAGLADEASS